MTDDMQSRIHASIVAAIDSGLRQDAEAREVAAQWVSCARDFGVDSPAAIGALAAFVRLAWDDESIHLFVVDESIPVAWQFGDGGLAIPMNDTFGVLDVQWSSPLLAWTAALEARIVPAEEHARRRNKEFKRRDLEAKRARDDLRASMTANEWAAHIGRERAAVRRALGFAGHLVAAVTHLTGVRDDG